jgi:hypothetical protein
MYLLFRSFWISLSASQTRRRHLDGDERQGWLTFAHPSCSPCITPFPRLLPAELVGQAETWGALETFRRRSKESDTVAELEDLMNQIFARRADAVVIPSVHNFP